MLSFHLSIKKMTSVSSISCWIKTLNNMKLCSLLLKLNYKKLLIFSKFLRYILIYLCFLIESYLQSVQIIDWWSCWTIHPVSTSARKVWMPPSSFHRFYCFWSFFFICWVSSRETSTQYKLNQAQGNKGNMEWHCLHQTHNLYVSQIEWSLILILAILENICAVIQQLKILSYFIGSGESRWIDGVHSLREFISKLLLSFDWHLWYTEVSEFFNFFRMFVCTHLSKFTIGLSLSWVSVT